jgi:hypothetical protein
LLHVDRETDKVSFGVLSTLLEVEWSNIRRYWSLYQKQGNENLKTGRDTILTPDEHEWVVEKIYETFSQNNPVTVCQMYRMIFDRFEKQMLPDTLYHVMRRESRIRTCLGKPMEDNRLQVTNKQLLEYFAALYSIVNGIPAHFVINMDEMGHRSDADAKDTTCFVPSTHPEATVNYPVSRVGKKSLSWFAFSPTEV